MTTRITIKLFSEFSTLFIYNFINNINKQKDFDMSRRRKDVTYSIPESKYKYVVLPDDPEFIFFENGDLYSLKTGTYLTRATKDDGADYYSIKCGPTNKFKTFSIKRAIKKFFHNQLPQIGIPHATIKDFPNYQLYANGKVWSRITYMWLKGATKNESYFVALVNEKGTTTFYPKNHLDEYFGDK